MKDLNAEKEAAIKRIAIECRKVRLYVAANPGQTAREIYLGTNISSCSARLYRMAAMGIVKFTQQPDETGRRPQRWFVVPQ